MPAASCSAPAKSEDAVHAPPTVFQVYREAVVEEMFLAAVHRLAERHGLEVLRIDVEDGNPA
jgi:hypothetical protein